MRQFSFNRLWVQISIVIAGVVLVAALALLGVTYNTRPQEPPDRPPPPELSAPNEERRDPLAGFLKFATQSALVLISTGTLLGIGAGIWLSRRMTAPLETLAQSAVAIGRGDLDVRVTPRGSIELIELADAFNLMAADLETAERLRQHLLADVAHELRTPLTVLQGNLRAILDDVYPLSKEEIARLYDQTRHLHRLVNDLHELAQVEAGRLPLKLVLLDMVSLASEAVDVFTPIADMEEVVLELRAETAPLMVFGDPARLMQVLQNLLANALRHTQAGGRVTVTVQHNAVTSTLLIKDTGDGIEAAHLPHIFDRFYRTDSARDRDAGGAGLGLAIVRALVEAHGGSVSVASAGRGFGSTFSVTLPLAASGAQ